MCIRDSIPGHALAGQAVKGHGGELLDHLVAQVLSGHIRRSACILECLLVSVNTVVSVGCELVRGLAELLLVLLNEGSGLFVGCVCVERGQEHNALGQLGIKAFHGQDAVHAVYAEELRCVAHCVCLGQDQGCRLIVHRQEYQVSALALCVVQLNGEVVSGSIGEGVVGNDLQALGLCLFYELVVNAGGVNVIVLPDDRNLGTELLLCDVPVSYTHLISAFRLTFFALRIQKT